jgi:hypothetical protein
VVFHRVSLLRGTGTAVPSNEDCCEGSCIIKDYRAVVLGMLIIIMLLAGFVPLLQVMFIALLEDLSIG